MNSCDPQPAINNKPLFYNYRHIYEQNILEENRMIEQLRRDIEAHNKIKRKLSVQLDKRKNELREFMVSIPETLLVTL